MVWVWAVLGLGCGPSTPQGHFDAAVAALEASDVPTAAEHLDAACSAGLIRGCLELSTLDGAEESLRNKAAELACDAGEADGCLARAVGPDDRWTTAACDAGRGSACLAAAAVASDPHARARLLAQACHGAELSACLPALDAWRMLGDLTRSAALAEYRCAAGAKHVCALVPALRAEGVRLQACEGGDAGACEESCLAGRLASCQEPLLDLACRDGDAVACTRLGQLQVAARQPQAGETLWLGCDRVDPWACLLLADWADAGHALPAEARGDAAWLRDQACDLQLDYACALLPR